MNRWVDMTSQERLLELDIGNDYLESVRDAVMDIKCRKEASMDGLGVSDYDYGIVSGIDE